MLFSWLSLSKRPIRQRKTTPLSRPSRSRLLHVEKLEGRLTPNAYTVNVLGDTSGSASGSGTGSSGDLRYCLSKAIADQQTDTITFDSTVFATAAQKIITLSSSLVTKPSAFINPYGQTSFIIGAGDNITMDGSLGANTPGITLNGGAATRLFAVAGGGTLQVKNLTLTGGQATGGAGGSANIGGAGGGGAGLGGGVLVDGSASSFTASGCTFANNQATGRRGRRDNNGVETGGRGRRRVGCRGRGVSQRRYGRDGRWRQWRTRRASRDSGSDRRCRRRRRRRRGRRRRHRRRSSRRIGRLRRRRWRRRQL